MTEETKALERQTIEKDWGFDSYVFSNHSTIIRRLEIKKGGKSTFGKFHFHRHKNNRFYVEKGLLKVYIQLIGGIQEYIIGDQQQYRKVDVYPGRKHRFEALEDSTVYEIYWSHCSNDDIVREQS